MNYTDTQLKQALAKMLPDDLYVTIDGIDLLWSNVSERCNKDRRGCYVLDTELLHMCWLVEQSLFPGTPLHDDYLHELKQVCDPEDYASSVGASWQQRVIALAKVKGIEIV